MQGPPIQTNFRGAYQAAQDTMTLVFNPQSVGLSNESVSAFSGFCSAEFIQKVHYPSKRTILHDLIANYQMHCIDWAIRKGCSETYLADFGPLLADGGICEPPWFNEFEIEGHQSELRNLLHGIVLRQTEDAFNLLFNNRSFLVSFSHVIAESIKNSGMRVARAKLPGWLTNAVAERDSGVCQLCQLPVNSPSKPEPPHFDHMIPLAGGGTNDPTNIQLVHRSCNLEKGCEPRTTDHFTHRPW